MSYEIPTGDGTDWSPELRCRCDGEPHTVCLRHAPQETRAKDESKEALVNRQANDPGLWFVPATAVEDYLQQALRNLHAAVERDARASQSEPVNVVESLPYPEDQGRTHWDGCWRELGHHNCAVRKVDRLLAAQEQVDAAADDLVGRIRQAIDTFHGIPPHRATQEEP